MLVHSRLTLTGESGKLLHAIGRRDHPTLGQAAQRGPGGFVGDTGGEEGTTRRQQGSGHGEEVSG